MLARLGRGGSTYTHASTSTHSDSFPSLLAQVTGGTPRTMGVFYYDSYSRVMWAPGTNCAGVPGAEVTYAENLDTTVSVKAIDEYDQLKVNAVLNEIDGKS